MKFKGIAAAVLLLAASPAAVAYKVEAITAKDWPSVAGKIAIAPSVCPPDFDCAWLNEVVAEYFAEHEPPVLSVDSQTVSQALLESGTDQLTDANRAQIAEALGVQSFFVVVVGNSEVKSTGAIATSIGHSVIMTPTTVGTGSLEVRVVSPDGKLLAKATGFGESGWRSGRRLIGAVFEDVFYRLFPEEEE